MPYLARTHQLKSSLLYHIFGRGNDRKEIFLDTEDYHYFINLLIDYSKKHSFCIYHWVLMPNHYHLLLGGYFNTMSLYLTRGPIAQEIKRDSLNMTAFKSMVKSKVKGMVEGLGIVARKLI